MAPSTKADGRDPQAGGSPGLIRLTLKAQPDLVPAELRLRALLKRLQRQYAYKAMGIEWLTPDGQAVEGHTGKPAQAVPLAGTAAHVGGGI